MKILNEKLYTFLQSCSVDKNVYANKIGLDYQLAAKYRNELIRKGLITYAKDDSKRTKPFVLTEKGAKMKKVLQHIQENWLNNENA